MATATERRATTLIATGQGLGYSVKNMSATIELAASASATVIDFGRIPSNARILGCSRIYKDDLATSGSPTLSLGLFPVNGNITGDDDALNVSVSLSASATDVAALADPANIGLPAWDLVNGVTADPKGAFLVRGTVRGAATTATGTITLDLYYVID